MKQSDITRLRDFERACDELFDEWLERWHGGAAAVSPNAVIVDRGDRYEVRVEAAVEDPEVIHVEVTEAILTVRVPAGTDPEVERRMSFTQAVDQENTTAQWADGILTVVLPKLRGRRVKVQ